MSDEQMLGTFLAAILGFLAVFLVVGLILYILQAIGLFKIAKREGRADLAWLAWIPIASTFLMTLIVENNVHKEFRGKLTLIYGIAFAASIILSSFIPFVGFLPTIVVFYAFYFFAAKFSTNPILHIVIAIVTFGIAMPIQIFIFRNRESIVPEDQGPIVDGPEL